MSVIRVNKTDNYTVMSNHHFKEYKMSLKAKGLLSEMLSLPNNWDYTIGGLVKINKDNETSVKSALQELKDFGYLIVTKKMPNETDTGRIEYIYDIYERPIKKQEGKKQDLEFLGVEFLGVENQGQLNTNKLNTKNKNTKYNIYGTFKRIKLTDEEYNKLVEEFGEDFINKQIQLLDEYVESNNNKNKYTNFNLVLRKSIRENWFKSKTEETPQWFKNEIPSPNASDEEWNEMLNSFN